MDSNDPKYYYAKHGLHSARVGQAVTDILSKDQPSYTTEEILEGFGAQFTKQLEQTVNDSLGKFKSPFYILALTKKEFWAVNVVRNWFIPRQSPPYGFEMMEQYPNHTKTLYVVDGDRGNIKVAWSIPAFSDCISIAKNKDLYHPELVDWVFKCFEHKLDRDSYEYLFKSA